MSRQYHTTEHHTNKSFHTIAATTVVHSVALYRKQ